MEVGSQMLMAGLPHSLEPEKISKIGLLSVLLFIVAVGIFFVTFEGLVLDLVLQERDYSMFVGLNENVQHAERDLYSSAALDAQHLPSTAFELTTENFEKWQLENEFVFINFYAPWCVWSQRLSPTWENLSREIGRQGIPMAVGKVDCDAHPTLCLHEKIVAFPTIRWFFKGQASVPDFETDRTLESLMAASRRKAEELELSSLPTDKTQRTTLEAPRFTDGAAALPWTSEKERMDERHPVSVTSLTNGNFNAWIKENDVALLYFFTTPWSTRSQNLASTWDKFANEVYNLRYPMAVGTVDCATQEVLCHREQIVTNPTFRWYVNGQAMLPGFSTDLMTDESVEGFRMVAGQMLELLETFRLPSARPEESQINKESSYLLQSDEEEDHDDFVDDHSWGWLFNGGEPEVNPELEAILRSPIYWQTSVSFDEASEEYVAVDEELESSWDSPSDDVEDLFFASDYYNYVDRDELQALRMEGSLTG